MASPRVRRPICGRLRVSCRTNGGFVGGAQEVGTGRGRSLSGALDPSLPRALELMLEFCESGGRTLGATPLLDDTHSCAARDSDKHSGVEALAIIPVVKRSEAIPTAIRCRKGQGLKARATELDRPDVEITSDGEGARRAAVLNVDFSVSLTGACRSCEGGVEGTRSVPSSRAPAPRCARGIERGRRGRSSEDRDDTDGSGPRVGPRSDRRSRGFEGLVELRTGEDSGAERAHGDSSR